MPASHWRTSPKDLRAQRASEAHTKEASVLFCRLAPRPCGEHGLRFMWLRFSKQLLKPERIKEGCWGELDPSVFPGRFQSRRPLEQESFIFRGNLMRANVVRETFYNSS